MFFETCVQHEIFFWNELFFTISFLFIRNCAGEFLDGFKDNIDKNQMIRTNPTGCGLLWELSGQGQKKRDWGLIIIIRHKELK